MIYLGLDVSLDPLRYVRWTRLERSSGRERGWRTRRRAVPRTMGWSS